MEWLDKKLTENHIPHTYDDDCHNHKKYGDCLISQFCEEDGSTFQIVIKDDENNKISDCIMIKDGSYGYEDGEVEYYNGKVDPEALTKEECLEQFIKDYKESK